MAVAQRMSEAGYLEFVASGSGRDGAWELHDGRLVEKPGMSWKHLDVVALLSYLLQLQIDRAEYRVFYRTSSPPSDSHHLSAGCCRGADFLWPRHPRFACAGDLL